MKPFVFRPAHALALLLAAVVLTTGCSVGPDYVPPTLDDGDWSESTRDSGPSVELGRWWSSFDDPTLDRLIETALAQNLDIRQAAERVAEARARRDWTAGSRKPTASSDASVTQRRQSRVGPLPIDRIPDLERDQTIWDAGFDVSWEADLFGRTRRSVEAADARVGESLEAARGAAFSVAAEVARTYFELRGGQHTLTALENAVDAAQKALDIARLRFEHGDVPRADVARASAELATLEARRPGVLAGVRSAALGLGILLGQPPETELGLIDSQTPPAALAEFPLGERADLLRRRPDVGAAERRLAAATAAVGVSMAALYPRLSIGARGGFQALSTSDLLSSDAVAWSLAPKISWRIFDGGRVRAEIRIAESRAREQALAWEQTVLGALTEAERALTRYLASLETIGLQDRALEAVRDSEQLARLRYQAGEAPLLDLLDARRGTSSAEEAWAAAHTAAATNLVSLYKALGGGWSDVEGSSEVAEIPSTTF